MNTGKTLFRRFGMRLTMTVAVIALSVVSALVGCSGGNTAEGVDSAESAATAVPTASGTHEERAQCADCHEGSDTSSYTYAKINACLECHGSYAELAEETTLAVETSLAYDLQYNPHSSRTTTSNQHFPNLECATCHTIHTDEHGASVMWCTACHEGMRIPDGWEATPFNKLTPKTMQ